MRRALFLMMSALTSVPSHAQLRTVNVGDAVINYEIAGEGTPVVLIHGWAQDLSIWDDQVAEFARHYRVIRYDRRGYGRSTGFADATADAMDLRILLDSLGLQSAHLLGLSAGSRAAIISGDHDLPLFLQVADTLVRRIPGAQRVVIPDAGHGAHFAQPAKFNAAVLRFLAAAERRPN